MTSIKATLKGHMGSDLSVVNAARVSFGKEAQPVGWEWYDYEDGSASGEYIAVLEAKDQKLIRYLAKHRHFSPFNHTFATFHVKAPIFVARQLQKHRFMPWNEISRRYVDDEPEFYSPETWRGRSEDKKQGSSDAVITELEDCGWDNDPEHGEQWYEETYSIEKSVSNFERHCRNYYDLLLRNDVAPEQARMVLPQSTMTEWYWSGTLGAFADMCRLRCAEDTQYETRIVADQISKVMGDLFPVSWTALMGADHG